MEVWSWQTFCKQICFFFALMMLSDGKKRNIFGTIDNLSPMYFNYTNLGETNYLPKTYQFEYCLWTDPVNIFRYTYTFLTLTLHTKAV